VGAKPLDVGDQALMRGLDTAGPIMRLGLSLSYGGRRHRAGHKAGSGVPLAVLHSRRCTKMGSWDGGQAVVRAGCPAAVPVAAISPAIAQRNPASSRATAVMATVDFLPLAFKAR
jgi:hypothetical protein